jgi:universal stress protein A
MLPLKKILCPTDFSEPSYAALGHAVELAAHFDAELCLLHVVPFSLASPADFTGISAVMMAGPPDAERLDEATRLLQEAAASRVPSGVKSRCEVKMGYADKEIVCAAIDGNFDLLVIATHGLSGWRHMVFGSVAEAIVRQSRCPVLTVHATPTVNEVMPALGNTAEQS